MSKTTWLAILERAMAMPEGQHICARYGDTTLLLERREDVLIAMREISPEDVDAASLAIQMQREMSSRPWQMLGLDGARYLCDWQRRPTDTGWLEALAAARF